MGVLADWQIQRDCGITPFAEGVKRKDVVSYGLTSYGYDVRLGPKFKVFRPFIPPGVPFVIDPKAFRTELLHDVDLTPSKHDWRDVKERQGEAREINGNFYCHTCGQTCYDSFTFMQPCKTPPQYLDIPPYSFVLGESVEEFDIPRDILVVVMGKSTYARCGLIVNVTPGEPEWKGFWTIELTNPTPLPLRVYVGEGIMQAIFLRSDGYRDLMVRVFKEWFAAGSDSWPRWKSVFASVWNSFWGKVTCDTSYADKKGKYQNQAGLTLPEVDQHTGA